VLLNPCYAIPLGHYLDRREDDVTPILINIFRAADSLEILARDCQNDLVPEPANTIRYQQRKIRDWVLQLLYLADFEDAVEAVTLPPMPASVTYVDAATSPVPSQPSSPPIDIKIEPFPVEIPTQIPPQVASCRAGSPSRNARKNRRKKMTTVLTTGLATSQTYRDRSNERYHSALSTPENTAASGSLIPKQRSLPTAPAEQDRIYENFVCRYCQVFGHRHKNCPRYKCRICSVVAPGHLTPFCPRYKGKALITRRASDPLFHADLKALEERYDLSERQLEEFESQWEHTYDDDPIFYHNQDC
jgi:hypothetical protein